MKYSLLIVVRVVDVSASLGWFPEPQGFPHSSVGKESTCNTWDLNSIPGSGRSPGEGIGYPLQYSGLENSKDRKVHGVAESQTRLSDFHSHFAWAPFPLGEMKQVRWHLCVHWVTSEERSPEPKEANLLCLLFAPWETLSHFPGLFAIFEKTV